MKYDRVENLGCTFLVNNSHVFGGVADSDQLLWEVGCSVLVEDFDRLDRGGEVGVGLDFVAHDLYSKMKSKIGETHHRCQLHIVMDEFVKVIFVPWEGGI